MKAEDRRDREGVALGPGAAARAALISLLLAAGAGALVAAPAFAVSGPAQRRGDLDGDGRLETVRAVPVDVPGSTLDDTVVRVYDRCSNGRRFSRRVAGPGTNLDVLRLRRADPRAGAEVFAKLNSGASARLWEVDLVAWRRRPGFPCRAPRGLFRYRSAHPTATPPGSDGGLSRIKVSLREFTDRYRGLELALDERFTRRGESLWRGSIQKVTCWRYSRARDRYVRYRTVIRSPAAGAATACIAPPRRPAAAASRGDVAHASPLRPPSVGERASVFGWVDRHPGVAGASSAVNRICVHRVRSRYVVVRFADVVRGGQAVLLRRRGGRWRRSTGGPVRRDLLRRSCALRPTRTAPPVDAAAVLAVDRFGPLALGMTYGGAQWATRTRLVRHDMFNPPCNTFGVRGLASLWGLTTNNIVRRLVITAHGPGLATAEGLRIGDNERRVIETYGTPDRRGPAPYIQGGEQLTYRTTIDPAAPRRRVITTDADDRVVEVSVGFTPEVGYDEGCA